MTRDGRLLGRDVECWFDTGAYADNGPRVTATAGDSAPGPYRWEAYRVDAACVHTNTAPAGSYRAFGATHLQWIGELQVDELARRAGLDPLEVRRRSLCVPGEELRAGGEVDPGDYPELMRRHFGLAGGELIGRGEVAPEGSGSYAEGPVFWEVCVGAAEVEVDEDTGRVRVVKTATVADVGKAINPL